MTSTFQFRVVATGGTFDHLHRGHKALLKEAFRVGERVIIGVSSDAFATMLKKKPDLSFEERVKLLKNYLDSAYPGRLYEIHQLNDYFGPGITDGSVEALVASEETKGRVKIANRMRAEKGFPPLTLVSLELLLAEDGSPISSTRIRRGEIDEEGKLLSKRV